MSFQYVGAGSIVKVTATTTITLGKPSNEPGDMLFACIIAGGAAADIDPIPFGWQLLRETIGVGVVYRIAGVNESSNETFTLNNSSTHTGVIVAYRGALNGDEIDDFDGASDTDASRTVSNGTPITTTRANALIMMFCGNQDGGDPGSFVVPSNFIERIDDDAVGNFINIADKIQNIAGGSGALDYTHDATSDDFGIITVSLKNGNLNKSHLAIGIL